MITAYFKTIRDEDFKKVKEFKPGTWINVENVKISDLKKIARLTGLEYADLKDSRDLYEVPRIERQNGTILIFVRNPTQTNPNLHTQPLTIVLTPKFIITISPQENSLIKDILNGNVKIATTQGSKLLIFILLKIAKQFTRQIKQVADNVARYRQGFKKVTGKDIAQLTHNEEVLNQYSAALVPMKNLSQTILTGKYIEQHPQDNDLIQDVLIAIRQSVDICQVNLKSIQSLRDAYQIIFTNDLNKVIKLFTSLTIILTIPTIIASIYGMNVHLPLQQHPLAFIFIMSVTLILSTIVLTIFNLKDWL